MKYSCLRYLLLLVSFMISFNALADVEVNAINFPDEAFRNWVLQNVSGASDGVLTDEEIAKVSKISCGDKSISSLQGIECFTVLRELYCASNLLTSLDVSKNTALTRLSCYSNQLTSLDVSKNKALTFLNCHSNQLTSLDVSGCTALTRLECYSNQLTSLNVSKNTALIFLNCGNNKLTVLDVSENTQLNYLGCYFNQLTGLNVSKNTALTQLDCYSNQLTSLDVSKNTALTVLHCKSNQLTSLDVSKNTSLNYLYCSSNQLTSLDVSGCTELTHLKCYSNQLTSLILSTNTALTYLECYSNKLTSLDISNNTALEELYCYSNQLTSLDVSKNEELACLDCRSNKLTSLDMSKNTALVFLDCSSNQLLILDLSKNTSVKNTLISYTKISPQFKSLVAVSISSGIAISVLSDFDFTRVTNLKLDDTSINGSITTVNGQKYLLFAPKETAQNSIDGKKLTYTYSTGNSFSQAASMDVTITLSYTATTPTGIEVNATNFPDEAFRNWILQNVSGASDGILTEEEIANVTRINCSGDYHNRGNITSLQGIEFFTALTSLDCSYNKLTVLDVSQNTALTDLYCPFNQLTTLDVSKNTALYYLFCSNNQLLYLNLGWREIQEQKSSVTPQSAALSAQNISEGIAIPVPTDFDFTKVSNLKLAGANANGSITTVDGQKYLVFAQSGTAQSTIDGKELTYTYSTGNKYSVAASMDVTVTLSYSPTTPTGIEVNATNFPDAAFRNWVLQNVSGASDGILTDEEIAKVTSIDCSGKYNAYGEMVNLKGIEFFTSLKSLTCRYNKLTSLNVSKNTALTSLDCSYNQLKSFDISGCTELTSLYCIENGMTSLNVSNNMALTSLSCYDNQLTSLNLSNHTALKRIDCQYNQLTNLNVSNCTALTYLQCNTNELTNLDVSTCLALANLYCHYNQLTSLDVSSNTNLKMLYCNNNQLTSLDVSKNTALTSLVCNANQLIYLNLGTNNKISDSETSISSQTAALTAKGISEGVAIPVPSDFDFSKVTNLKLAGSSVTGSVATVNGQKYLVFAQLSTAQNAIDGKQLTYTYNTGNSYSKAASMDVTVTLSYSVVTYSLSIQSRSGGSVTYNETTIKNTTQTFTVNEGVSVTITMTPDNGYRLASLTVNGTNVTSSVKNNQYTIDNITTNTTVVATFEEIPVTTFSLSIQSGTGGSVSYDGTTITNKTQSFTVAEGTSATITISPNTGYKLSRLTVNGTNVTSNVKDNQYTISSIAGNTTVVATFEQITYTLTVQATGNGTVTFNSTGTKNTTHSFTVNHGSSATLTISADNGYRLASLTVNGTKVTSSVSNNQYTISSITANTTVVATFEQIPATTYSLSIQSGAGGSVSYDGTTITNKTQSFTIAEGSSVTIEMTPSNGYKLASLVVNETDVTSGVENNQYTISNITTNTTVVVTFKAMPQNISLDGINYEVRSATDYTLNVGKGNYSGHVVIPVTVSYDGDTWTVAGVVDGAFNLSAITAITWNPNTAIGNGAFGAETNPNLLLYVKSEAYAPTNVQNVIANGRAKKIVLTDAASGNDFNCPEAFTAEEISYTHRYGMTTGIGECRGWETIALPFTVQKVMHQTKGQLVTFKQWDQSTSAKPYWLYKLTYTGFAEADFIEANTPYVISMPNHEKYFVDYILAGNVIFSAENATVKTSENMTMPTCNDKTFRPCFAKTTQSGVYAINAVNSWVTNTGGYKEGSVFVEGLRPVLPFEAYMTTNAANAKGIIPIFETQPTAIREIPMQDMRGVKGVKVYNLNGQLVLWSEDMTREEALKRLPAGIYIMNGKKITIK